MNEKNANDDRTPERPTELADVVPLSQADGDCFTQALLSPPQLSPAMARAFVRRGKLLQADWPF
jgi:hypothetical protein